MPYVEPIVTEKSSDEEIMAAIDKAGEFRHSWRREDWPKEGSNNTLAWVKPSDIGHSTHDDPFLLRRLRKMVKAGLLEERYGSIASFIDRSRGCEDWISRGMFPRFRVVRK